MDVTTKALALRATDYKENDKLVSLYSLDHGKISVHAKGVRKNGAKLKFAADQFCFGVYELAKTNDRYTLKTCDQLESFFSLRENIESYYAACAIAECLINFTEEGQSEPKVFVETLYALKTLCEGVDARLVISRFLAEFLKLEGFGLSFSRCQVCSSPSKNLFWDNEKGGIACENCVSADFTPISPKTLSALVLTDGLPYGKLGSLKLDDITKNDCVALCEKLAAKNFFPLKSLKEFIKLY